MSSGTRERSGRGPAATSTATRVRNRVFAGNDRFWTFEDFSDLNPGAVAHALSRLAASGELQRVRKGLYYRPKPTVLGLSRPSASEAVAATVQTPLHPAGLTAANALGLSTQNPGRPEYATSARSAPTMLGRAVVHTRRPAARAGLGPQDGALLELLRERARSSDLSPAETIRRLLTFVQDSEDFVRLATAATEEPPRVRAMLGALGQQADAASEAVALLRESLNPLSRFEFGVLGALEHAREWQAR